MRLLTFLAALLVALPAFSATRNFKDDHTITWLGHDVAGGFQSCSSNPTGGCGWTTPTATGDDDFIIDNRTFVQLRFDPGLTANGSIDILSDGVLEIPPGETLTSAGWIAVRGGTLAARGEPKQIVRVQGLTEANATITIDLPSAPPANADSGMYVVFLNDDFGTPNASITAEQQVGGGPPEPGKWRPTPLEYQWFPITAQTATSVTIDIAQADRPADGGNPGYTGTRGQLVGASAITATSVRRGNTGQGSIITTTGAFAGGSKGDFGSHWIRFTAGTDPECAGKKTKVMYFEDAGATERFWVMADVTALCGQTPTFEVVKGAQVGDLIAIVNPAVINGGGTGWICVEAGRFQAEWAIFTNMGAVDTATRTSAGETCDKTTAHGESSLFFQRQSATVQPDFGNSYWVNSSLRYFFEGATSTNTISFASNSGPTVPLAFGVPLDLTGFRMSGLEFTDSANDVVAGGFGAHVIRTAHVVGLEINGFVIARHTDDGIFSTLNCGGGVALSETYTDGKIWEMIPNGTVNSGNAVDLNVQGLGTATCSNAVRLTNLMMVTSDIKPRYVNAFGASPTGIVVGGVSQSANAGLEFSNTDAYSGCFGNGNPDPVCTGSGLGPGGATTWPTSMAAQMPTVNDSIIFYGGFSNDIGQDVATWNNSIMWGIGAQGVISNPNGFNQSIIFCDDCGTSLIRVGTSYLELVGSDFSIVDTLVYGLDTSGTRIANRELGVNLDLRYPKPVLRRSYIVRNNQTGAATNIGWLAGWPPNIAAYNFDVDHSTISSDSGSAAAGPGVSLYLGASAISGKVDAGTDQNLDTVCVSSTNNSDRSQYPPQFANSNRAFEFRLAGGPTLPTSLVNAPEIGLDSTAQQVMTTFLAEVEDGDGCSNARPARLGLSQWLKAHTWLGDFAYIQRDDAFAPGQGLGASSSAVSAGGGGSSRFGPTYPDVSYP